MNDTLKELIIAWLNGEELQWQTRNGHGQWHQLSKFDPTVTIYFHPSNNYRRKPKEPDYLQVYLDEYISDYYPGRRAAAGVDAVIAAHLNFLKETGQLK